MEKAHNNLRAALHAALDELTDAPKSGQQLGLPLPSGNERNGAGPIEDHETAAADLLGLPETAARCREVVRENNSAKGRPRGYRNHRTEYWIAYLARRYASPLEVLAQIANAPVDVLARELHCTRLDALREKRHAAESLAPYMHQRLALVELAPPGHPGGPAVPLILAEQEGVEIIDHPPAAVQTDATNASNAEAAFDATQDPFGFTAAAQARFARPSSVLELPPHPADKSDDEPR